MLIITIIIIVIVIVVLTMIVCSINDPRDNRRIRNPRPLLEPQIASLEKRARLTKVDGNTHTHIYEKIKR